MLDDRLATAYVPLWIDGAIRGRLRRDVVEQIDAAPELESGPLGRRLREGDGSRASRSRALQRLAMRLRDQGLVADWRNERCSVIGDSGQEIARCERGAFRTLGMRNRAVHVNGFTAAGHVWVARRSARKRSDPLRLDNLAAGGIAAGESLRRCALRELWEEAGVAADLARAVDFPAITLQSLREVQFGIHDELIIVADLCLPDSFEPHNRDGEVAEFMRMTRSQVEAALAREEFTIEAAACMREFLRRTQ
jgi:8-oxo-dGTP pyrophosphatase MutT (NUDIX family)